MYVTSGLSRPRLCLRADNADSSACVIRSHIPCCGTAARLVPARVINITVTYIRAYSFSLSIFLGHRFPGSTVTSVQAHSGLLKGRYSLTDVDDSGPL